MKKFALPLFLAAMALASCSDDDSTPANPDAQTLAKTITYYPLESNYTSKRIAYFNNGEFAADTLFDGSGAIIENSVVTATANTKTVSHHLQGSTYSVTQTFDTQGRLILITSTVPNTDDIVYTYNTDGSITYSNPGNNGQQVDILTFYTDTNGLVTSLQYANNNPAEEAYITFSNAAPSEYITVFNGSTEQVFTTFTFYNVEKPQNAQLSVIERNNRIIQQAQLNQVADTHQNYLKSYNNLWEFDSTFDAANYIVYSKYTSVTNAGDTNETFFYYE